MIDYVWFDAPPRFDVDNIIKPIADSLPGIVYANDRQMAAVACERFAGRGLVSLVGPSPALVAAYAAASDFIHVELTLR